MSVREQALQAVLADPDDDTARLIYADACEHEGDPARAELIRVQVELARLQPWDASYGRLSRQERCLLRRHRLRWLDEVDVDPRIQPLHFVRGFVEEVVAHADGLEAIGSYPTPVRHVEVRGRHNQPPQRGLAQVRSVELPMEDLELLPWFPGLEALEVGPQRKETPWFGQRGALDAWGTRPPRLRQLKVEQGRMFRLGAFVDLCASLSALSITSTPWTLARLLPQLGHLEELEVITTGYGRLRSWLAGAHPDLRRLELRYLMRTSAMVARGILGDEVLPRLGFEGLESFRAELRTSNLPALAGMKRLNLPQLDWSGACPPVPVVGLGEAELVGNDVVRWLRVTEGRFEGRFEDLEALHGLVWHGLPDAPLRTLAGHGTLLDPPTDWPPLEEASLQPHRDWSASAQCGLFTCPLRALSLGPGLLAAGQLPATLELLSLSAPPGGGDARALEAVLPPALPELRVLQLADWGLDDRLLAAILERAPRLEQLDASNNAALTASSVERVLARPGIRAVDLSGTAIPPQVLVRALQHLPLPNPGESRSPRRWG